MHGLLSKLRSRSIHVPRILISSSRTLGRRPYGVQDALDRGTFKSGAEEFKTYGLVFG